MEYQVIWFILWGVLWTVYFVLDGFDLGAGALSYFLARTDTQKRCVIQAIGPVWNGNEVWLLTAGGATFAAFPGTYASMFSYLYTALLLLLFSLILRGVSLEFRGMAESKSWKRGWDLALLAGSFLPALLLGVAFGNIFRGLPIDGSGYHGSLIYLLNPYGLLTGILFVLMFLIHGALWLSMKVHGETGERATALSGRLWYALLAVAACFLVCTGLFTSLFVNYLHYPVLFIIPVLAVASLIGIKILLAQGAHKPAFYASGVTIALIAITGLAGLYPNLIPSNPDPAFSLTIFNSSSSVYTLKIMTVVALIFVPIVIAYQAWSYRIFRGAVAVESDSDAY